MHNEKVTYGKSFEMLGYWEKIGVEGDLDEGETLESALDNYKERFDKWHKKNNPEMYPDTVIKVKKESPNLSGVIAEDLKTITELKVLTSFEILCRKEPLKSIYEEQLKKLSK